MNPKDQSELTRALKARGLYHERCGAAAMMLCLRLRREPLAHAERVRGAMKKHGCCSVGTLMRAGLAQYLAAEKLYVITPAGETWLSELEIHGFLGSEGRIQIPQEVTA
jgi:hypothetical protein